MTEHDMAETDAASVRWSYLDWSDQGRAMYFFRPVPGWSRYATPIEETP